MMFYTITTVNLAKCIDDNACDKAPNLTILYSSFMMLVLFNKSLTSPKTVFLKRSQMGIA